MCDSSSILRFLLCYIRFSSSAPLITSQFAISMNPNSRYPHTWTHDTTPYFSDVFNQIYQTSRIIIQRFMSTNPDSHQDDHLCRSHASPGLKRSIIVSKGSPQPQVFNFASKSPTSFNVNAKKDVMTKSFLKKDSIEVDSFMKEIRDKMTILERTLSDHDREISEIRESRNNSFLSSSGSSSRAQSLSGLSGEVVRNIKREFQEQTLRLQSSIFSEIEAIKSQLRTDCIKKLELETMFGRFEGSANVTRQMNELRGKIKLECESIYSRLTQQINTKIRQFHESNAKYFTEINRFIDSIKSSVESIKQQYKPSFATSTQKCYSPKLIKYKEVLQKLPSTNLEKEGQQIVANEVTYYLDKQGHLLDSNHYYLLDKNGKQIKMDYKQLTLFNIYDLLR